MGLQWSMCDSAAERNLFESAAWLNSVLCNVTLLTLNFLVFIFLCFVRKMYFIFLITVLYQLCFAVLNSHQKYSHRLNSFTIRRVNDHKL